MQVINLEKAYNRLEWYFIRKFLLHFGFPMNMVKLIMSCILSSSSFLLFNGEKLPSFSPTRGIRQEDPLSPFIFPAVYRVFELPNRGPVQF